MTKSSWISRSFFALLIAVVSLLPAAAFASVKITDVMYDPPGADTGHEWIKIENTGTTTIDLAGYRLAEGGTNHKLTVAAGTSTLAAGAKAIIATDPAQYAADHPLFTGALFKSSFSLSNTGETIELKDPALVVVDTYSYTAPVVVKEPAPAKVAKSLVKSSAALSNKKSSSYSYADDNQPAIPSVWLYAAGLVALLLLGAAAALYAKPLELAVTQSAPEEFELE